MRSIVIKLISVMICIGSFFIMGAGDFDDFHIVIGTLVLISGVTVWIFSSPKEYNEIVSSTKQIVNERGISIEDFYEAFKNHESLLGKPWLGKIKTIKGKCLIFGPTSSGNYLYMHKMLDCFYLSTGLFPSFISGPKDELHRLSNPTVKIDSFSNEEIICFSMLAQSALEDVYEVLNEFSLNNRVMNFPSVQSLGQIYYFSEEFKASGQQFYLNDLAGNQLYKMDGTFPLKTFTIQDMRTGEELLKLTKRIMHVLAHYDFYLNGREYGSFEKKIDLFHDKFEMKTEDGVFQLQSINDSLGTNYIIKLDNRVIATIAEKLNLSLRDIVFDNFILYVKEEKYVSLVCAFALMAARELKRDENAQVM